MSADKSDLKPMRHSARGHNSRDGFGKCDGRLEMRRASTTAACARRTAHWISSVYSLVDNLGYGEWKREPLISVSALLDHVPVWKN